MEASRGGGPGQSNLGFKVHSWRAAFLLGKTRTHPEMLAWGSLGAVHQGSIGSRYSQGKNIDGFLMGR